MAVSGIIANASASCFVEFDAKINISGDYRLLLLYICFPYLCIYVIINVRKYFIH